MTLNMDALSVKHLQECALKQFCTRHASKQSTNMSWIPLPSQPLITLLSARGQTVWSRMAMLVGVLQLELLLRLRQTHRLRRLSPVPASGLPPKHMCSRPLLLHSILRADGVILPVDWSPRIHPEDSSGQEVHAKGSFTQGAVHRRVFGPMVWGALLLNFGLKRLMQGGVGPKGLPLVRDYWRGGRWAARHI